MRRWSCPYAVLTYGSGFVAANNIKRFAFHNLHTAGTAGIKACGDMSKDTCAAHEAHESLAHG